MGFKPRIDSHFNLNDLVESIVDPQLITVSREKKPDYRINFSTAERGGRKYRIKILGLIRSILSTDDIMGKIPHETVCNLLDGSSDMKLWKMGLQGTDSHLSPDFVSKEKRLFVEIATSMTSDPASLQDRLNQKIIHYDLVAKNNGYSIGVVVVSPDSIFTNLNLEQEVANALCHRYRAGLAIRSHLEKIEGRSLSSEEATASQRIVKGVIKELSRKQSSKLKSNKHFPIGKILDFTNPPKASELKKAARLLRRCKEESAQKSSMGPSDLDKYIQGYGPECRTSDKRVGNIPMVLPKSTKIEGFDYSLDVDESDMPSWLKTIWKDSEIVEEVVVPEEDERKEALGKKDYEQHRIQKTQCFHTSLDEEGKEQASVTGLWGKSMKTTDTYREHYLEGKFGFHPVNSDIRDIESFISGDSLDSYTAEGYDPVPQDIMSLLADAKEQWGKGNELGLKSFQSLSRTKLIHHASLVTRLFTEICYCYKYWIKRADFYKKWCGKIQMVVRCVGDHTFVSFAFPKKDFSSWEPGRLGPKLFESRNYIFTDICSYNEPTIEHFVKAGPYFMSILTHLQSNMEVPLEDIAIFSSHVRKTIAGTYLLYLNNKTDSGELVTNQRYLNMVVLEDLDPNPYKFVKRLPDMYKSRLACYLFKQTVREIERFKVNPPRKVSVDDSGITTLEIDSLRGLFSNEPLTFRQKINEFYLGYVVSKERGRGADRNFKIMKKIVEQEYKYRDDNHPLFSDEYDIKDNQTHVSLTKTMLFLYKQMLQERYGDSWRDLMMSSIVSNLADISFLEIATLKVSSRDYSQDFTMPSIDPGLTTSEINRILSESNPEESKSRPKVMESLSRCVELYMEETKTKDLKHIIQLVPWALAEIEKRGYFYSDIFPKPQHGGDREIHVLEFRARLIQLYIERISRTMCEMTSSDSLTHPNLKESFVKNHYNLAEMELPSARLTMGKSADASKWCQRNHASKFAAILVGILPAEFHVGVLRILWFWVCKVIVFPFQFVSNFLSNSTVESNKIYMRMREEFMTGTGIFEIAKTNRMTIISGMMQGILHYTSSLMHGVIQEGMARVQKNYLRRQKINSVITIIQGSDDSGELISLSGRNPRDLARIGTLMLHWKERVSRFFSIYSSYEKSCIGSTDLVEYNSEWSVRKTTLKPTFRWVSSCLEVGIVEKFIDRIGNFYNTAKDVLEGGGSVLETSVIQLSQGWMHYWMIGIGNSVLGHQAAELMKFCKDPSLGYFPLDADICAAMPGVNFLLYNLYKNSSYGVGVTQGKLPDADLDMYEEDVKDVNITRDLRKVKLKFGNHRIFEKVVKGMNVPTLEVLLKDAESNPELIYYPESTWSGSKTKIYMKVFEPGVKESLSRHSATARILSASAYILSRPCLSTVTKEGTYLKISLMKALTNSFSKIVLQSFSKLPIQDVFVHAAEYEDLLETIKAFSGEMSVQQMKLKTRSKHKVTVLDRTTFDVSIVELCKQMWFDRGGRTGLSSSQIGRKWEQAKTYYPFLKDSRTETEKTLNMTAVQLRSFLDSLQERPRRITLLDTAAKGGSLRSVISRVFWPNTKLHLKDEGSETSTISSIRSEIFSICSHWMSHPDKLIAISKILSENKLLQSENVPQRLKKLAIMRMSLSGVPHDDLLSKILADRLGVVGFFTVSQKGWGWNRQGFGEWKGRILDVSCVIEFQNSTCTKIIMDKVPSGTEFGFLAKDFIESTCSSFPDEYKDSDHWLSPDGRLNGGRGAMKAIPIFVDTDLVVRIFDELQDKEWVLETSNCNIRLKAVFPRGQLITILSDKFGSYEWDPAFKVDEKLEYADWNNSEPMSISKMEKEFSSILNGTKSITLKQLKKIDTLKTASGWKVSNFVEGIRSFFSLQRSLPQLDSSQLVQDLEPLSKEEEDLMADLVSGEVKIDWSKVKNPSEMFVMDEEEGEEADFFLDGIDDDDLDRVMRLLMEERQDQVSYSRTTMPPTNRCFSNLDTLSKIHTGGLGFQKVIEEFSEKSQLRMSGLLGKIISCLLQEDRMERLMTQEEAEAFKQEEESVSLMTSIRSNAKAAELSSESLKKNIDHINELLVTASGFARDTLIDSKFRLERLLYHKEHPTKAEAIGERLSTDFFLDNKDLIAKSSDKLRVVSEMDNDIYFHVLKQELDKLVLDLMGRACITPAEEPTYREAIHRINLTTLLVDLVSELTGKEIEVGGYKIGGDENVVFDPDL